MQINPQTTVETRGWKLKCANHMLFNSLRIFACNARLYCWTNSNFLILVFYQFKEGKNYITHRKYFWVRLYLYLFKLRVIYGFVLSKFGFVLSGLYGFIISYLLLYLDLRVYTFWVSMYLFIGFWFPFICFSV